MKLHYQIGIGFLVGLIIGYILNVAHAVGSIPYQICDAVGAVVVGRLEGEIEEPGKEAALRT